MVSGWPSLLTVVFLHVVGPTFLWFVAFAADVVFACFYVHALTQDA